MQDRADKLSEESQLVDAQLTMVNDLSNLAPQLYSWYIKHGHARNEKDIKNVESFFEKAPARRIRCG